MTIFTPSKNPFELMHTNSTYSYLVRQELQTHNKDTGLAAVLDGAN